MPQRPRFRPRRLGLLPLIVAAALGAGAVDARADTAALTVTDTAGAPDPAAEVARVFTFTGSSATPQRFFVKFRNVGGAPCAPTAYSDTGSTSSMPYGRQVNGAFTIKDAITWQSPGSVLFCMWIAKDSEEVTTPIQQTVTFRSAGATVGIALAPGAPLPGQASAVTFTGATEAPAELYASVKPGGGCAPTPATDTGERIVSGRDVSGTFSVVQPLDGRAAGVYTLCAWVGRSSSDVSPLAGPQPLVFTVAAPAPTPAPPAAPSPPACAVVTSSVRRGRALRVRCYRTAGPVRIRLRRNGRTVRTVTATLSRGVARVGTRSLRRGARYRVTVLGSTGKIGTGTVRIRR